MNSLICLFIMVLVTNGELSKTTSKKKRSFGFGIYGGDYAPNQPHHHDYDFGLNSNDGYYLNHHQPHLHSHTLVTKKIGYPIPQPYPVPYPIKVPVERPVPVPVPVHHHHPVPVPIVKHIPYPVVIEKPYPIPVFTKPHDYHHDYHHNHHNHHQFSSWPNGGHGYW